MTSRERTPAGMPASAAPPKRRRWGLLTLACLALVMFSIIVAVLQGHHTIGTLGCILFGVIGAFYCTVKGLTDVTNLGWYKRHLGNRSDRED